MKVLILNDYGTPTGGAEHMSLGLRDGLRARGHDARLLSSTAAGVDGVPVAADYTCYGTNSALRRVLQAGNPFARRALARVLDAFAPDVVHVRMFLSQLSPLILPLLRPFPAVLHVVNYDLICPINTKVLPDGSPCRVRQGAACRASGCMSWGGMARFAVQRWLLWRGFDAFDLVVTNSHWVRRRLMEDGVLVDEVVWNGVPAAPQRPPLSEPPTVACAARLVPKKGIEVLIAAMARVVRDVPDARLLIAGEGPQRAALEEQSQRAGLAQHITFLGHLPRQQVERHFAAAWVQVAPSLWEEPFGLVAAEAMMRGTAAVVSGGGGLAEQVLDGQTGFHVPPGDAAALADVLARLLRDRPLCESLGAAARSHALANFTEDRVVQRFEALYARVTAPRTASAKPAPPARAAGATRP